MSIAQIGTKFINEIADYFSAGQGMQQFGAMERDITKMVQHCACAMVACYLEEVDAHLLADKAARRAAGYSVERRHDVRHVLTTFGELSYTRTYYAHKDGGYAYLADQAVGLEGYSRVSDGVSVALAEAACRMSYAGSSRYVTEGAVSRQTVLHKVRACDAARVPEDMPKRAVRALHIDADEAHITLRGGKRRIVPLISVYEGIERGHKRNRCKEVFHISEYGKTTEALWEQALTEVESRYDLSDTMIYLHGDGAAWVKTGAEWFSGAVFVLDKYHKNKEITAMTAGLETTLRTGYQDQIRYALAQNDSRFLLELADSLTKQLPWREATIRQAAGYLNNQIDGIAICTADPEANNGGCTEPHVSHVLSSRLSSRPMAWSAETLKKLAPMLAGGGTVELHRGTQKPQGLFLARATRAAAKALKRIPFAPNPRATGALQPIAFGKRSSLFKALNGISHLWPL